MVDLLEINRRGDQDFEGLSDVEKNLYCVFLFQTLYEMEGFTHFFGTQHIQHLPRVLAFLGAARAPNRQAVQKMAEFLKREVGSWDPEAIDEFLCDRGSEHEAKINAWGEAFYAQVDAMWERVRTHVRERHGIEIEPA